MPKHSVPRQRGRAIQAGCEKTRKKKVLQKKMAKLAVWKFFYDEWCNDNCPGERMEDGVFYEGKFSQCCTNNGDFLYNKLLPALKRGYVTMKNKDGKTIPGGSLFRDLMKIKHDEVVIRFNCEKIIEKMHRYLPRSVLKTHYKVVEECGGWELDAWKNGKRAIYRL
jgi:hypothetical protein